MSVMRYVYTSWVRGIGEEKNIMIEKSHKYARKHIYLLVLLSVVDYNLIRLSHRERTSYERENHHINQKSLDLHILYGYE